jgi:hypothetical protein
MRFSGSCRLDGPGSRAPGLHKSGPGRFLEGMPSGGALAVRRPADESRRPVARLWDAKRPAASTDGPLAYRRSGYIRPTTWPSGSAKSAIVVSGATSVSGMITFPPSCSTRLRVPAGSSV